ncbi:MAG: hypothetical protein V4689_04615 [Verrucomicrobiota bacterium]
MPNSRYTPYLIAGLFITSVAGWGTAWNNSRRGEPEPAEGRAGPGRSSSRVGDRPEARQSLGSLMENPRSAKLLNEMVSISAEAKPGQVNAKLIAACRATLTDPDPESRNRDFALLLTQMRAEDGAAMHELFLELDAAGKPLPNYSAFATRWGEVDGKGAYVYLFNEVPPRMPARDLRDIARGWGAKDPQAALAWMTEHVEIGQRFGGLGRVFEGWVRGDSDGATAWLLKQKPGIELVDCVAGAMPEQLHCKDMMTSIDWLVALPDDGIMGMASQQGWRTALDNLNELSYQNASTIWGKVKDQPWAGFGQFERLADQASRTRSASEGMGGFLNELSNSWPAEEVTSKFQEWSEKDPERTSAWLAKAPPSAVRTAAIQGLVATLEKSDPEAAAQWREALVK